MLQRDRGGFQEDVGVEGHNCTGSKNHEERSALAVIPLLPRPPPVISRGCRSGAGSLRLIISTIAVLRRDVGRLQLGNVGVNWGSAQRKMYDKQKWHSSGVFFMVRGWPIGRTGRTHLCRSCRVIGSDKHTTMDGTACSNEASGTRSGWIQSHAGGLR